MGGAMGSKQAQAGATQDNLNKWVTDSHWTCRLAMGQNPGTRLFTPDIVIIVGKSPFIFSKYRISHSFWSTSHIAMSQNTSTLGTLKWPGSGWLFRQEWFNNS
jgi:hypothetical protein